MSNIIYYLIGYVVGVFGTIFSSRNEIKEKNLKIKELEAEIKMMEIVEKKASVLEDGSSDDLNVT